MTLTCAIAAVTLLDAALFLNLMPPLLLVALMPHSGGMVAVTLGDAAVFAKVMPRLFILALVTLSAALRQ